MAQVRDVLPRNYEIENSNNEGIKNLLGQVGVEGFLSMQTSVVNTK
jgi:cell division ATPase FtsA